MAKFTADLRNLQRLTRQLKSPKPLMQTGFKVIDELTKNWDKGQGGDGRAFSKKISDRYAAQKAKSGRKPVINFSWTGAMRRAMIVLSLGKHKVNVTFAGAEAMQKARDNFARRPTMMKIGDAMRKKIIKFFYKKVKEA